MNPYSYFKKQINENIKTIVELGVNKYQYTYQLLEDYNPEILYAFEAHPFLIEYCRNNISDSRIVYVEKAVANYDGEIQFYDLESNPGDLRRGASSVFERIHAKHLQKEPVSVECTRLDSFLDKDTKIDLLCMDIQGAELMALESMGDLIENLSYVILECPLEGKHLGMHKGAPSRKDLFSFLEKNDFSFVDSIYENDWEDNVLFAKKDEK